MAQLVTLTLTPSPNLDPTAYDPCMTLGDGAAHGRHGAAALWLLN